MYSDLTLKDWQNDSQYKKIHLINILTASWKRSNMNIQTSREPKSRNQSTTKNHSYSYDTYLLLLSIFNTDDINMPLHDIQQLQRKSSLYRGVDIDSSFNDKMFSALLSCTSHDSVCQLLNFNRMINHEMAHLDNIQSRMERIKIARTRGRVFSSIDDSGNSLRASKINPLQLERGREGLMDSFQSEKTDD